MHLLPLLTLSTASVIGAYLSASAEDTEIHHQNTLPHPTELPHLILVGVRSIAATLLILLIAGWHPILRAAALLMMVGATFAPPHRLLLWWLRVKRHPLESRNLPFYHLRKNGYDVVLFFITNEKARFITICCTELLIATAIFIQLLHP